MTRSLTATALAFILSVGSAAAETRTDIAYGTASARQVLDLHLPDGAGPHPVLIDIHGGAFRMGDKAMSPVPPALLAAGIAVVRPNYRLSSEALWPAQGDDIAAVIAWVRENGAEHGLDPQRLALSGQSAGGFLAASAALDQTEAGTSVAAVVDFYGPMAFGEMDADMAALGRSGRFGPTDGPDSPESVLLGFVVGDDPAAATAAGPVGRLTGRRLTLPPLLIRHGDADDLISHLQSERLRDAWSAADPEAPVDFALLPGAGHGGAAFEADAVIGPMVAFLMEHMK